MAAANSRDDIDKLVSTYRADREEEEEPSDDEGWQGKKPFVDYASFNMAVGLVIAANAVTIGLETDARSGGADPAELSAMWYYLEVVFCFLFMTELGLRLFFHGTGYFYAPVSKPLDNADCAPRASGCRAFCPEWSTLLSRLKYSNIMDFFIVTTSLVDTFLLVPLGSGGGARFVSMLRFVRLLRLIRLVRLFKIFKELWLVANGLINAMKTLLWVCVMIFIVCYIGGIFATLWVGQNDKTYDNYFKASGWDHEVYFGTVPRSLFTLFQVITLDQWSDSIARHVIKNQPGMLFFFLVLICIVTFGLLNIIVGVVVENALSTASKDQRKIRKAKDADRQLIFSQLREIFEEADVDGSGTLTYDEVEQAISKREIYNKLRMIDFPVDDPQQIFELLDWDESGELTIDEFITGCLRMKGTAKSKDLLVAQVALDCMKRHYGVFEKELATLQTKLNRLEATALAITDHGERVFLDMQKYRLRHPGERGGSLPRMNTIVMKKAPWEEDEASGAESGEDQQAIEVYDRGGQKLRVLGDGESQARGNRLALPEQPDVPMDHFPAIGDQDAQGMLQDRGLAALRDVDNLALAVPGSLPDDR